jgi:hypothetical protein
MLGRSCARGSSESEGSRGAESDEGRGGLPPRPLSHSRLPGLPSRARARRQRLGDVGDFRDGIHLVPDRDHPNKSTRMG